LYPPETSVPPARIKRTVADDDERKEAPPGDDVLQGIVMARWNIQRTLEAIDLLQPRWPDRAARHRVRRIYGLGSGSGGSQVWIRPA